MARLPQGALIELRAGSEAEYRATGRFRCPFRVVFDSEEVAYSELLEKYLDFIVAVREAVVEVTRQHFPTAASADVWVPITQSRQIEARREEEKR